MNYTKPYDKEYKDDPQDWLNGALIFGRALSLLIEEDTGIVVDLKGDAQLSSQPDAKKVVVYRSQGMIFIDSMNHDLPEGSFVKIQLTSMKMDKLIDKEEIQHWINRWSKLKGSRAEVVVNIWKKHLKYRSL